MITAGAIYNFCYCKTIYPRIGTCNQVRGTRSDDRSRVASIAICGHEAAVCTLGHLVHPPCRQFLYGFRFAALQRYFGRERMIGRTVCKSYKTAFSISVWIFRSCVLVDRYIRYSLKKADGKRKLLIHVRCIIRLYCLRNCKTALIDGPFVHKQCRRLTIIRDCTRFSALAFFRFLIASRVCLRNRVASPRRKIEQYDGRSACDIQRQFPIMNIHCLRSTSFRDLRLKAAGNRASVVSIVQRNFHREFLPCCLDSSINFGLLRNLQASVTAGVCGCYCNRPWIPILIRINCSNGVIRK